MRVPMPPARTMPFSAICRTPLLCGLGRLLLRLALLGHLVAVPPDGALEPLAQVDARPVADELERALHVGERVAHVAGPRGLQLRLDLVADDLADHGAQPRDRHAVAARDVHELAGRLRRLA